MNLSKSDLQAKLTLLGISYSHNAGEENLTGKLVEGLQFKLDDMDVEYVDDADMETLLDLYHLTMINQADPTIKGSDEDDYYEFIAKIGFRQPWHDGVFSMKKGEEFDCDDEKLIQHLFSNNLIKRQES